MRLRRGPGALHIPTELHTVSRGYILRHTQSKGGVAVCGAPRKEPGEHTL